MQRWRTVGDETMIGRLTETETEKETENETERGRRREEEGGERGGGLREQSQNERIPDRHSPPPPATNTHGLTR